MTEVPTWLIVTWLVISGLMFFFNLLFWGALVFVLLTRVKPAMETLTGKVEELSGKLDDISQKVQALTETVQERVDDIGTKTSSILGSVELILQQVTKQVERFAPYSVAAMTAMKLVKALNEMRHGKDVKESTTGESLLRRKATTKNQRGTKWFGLVKEKRKKFLGLF
jgi:uncharacterized protein YoxC